MIEGRIIAEAARWQPVETLGAPRSDTGGRLVYAIGDIHGCYDQLCELLAVIAADASALAGGRTPMLVLLGDYVDRGPASAQVLEAVSWLRNHATFEVHALAGNHEQMLLDFLDDPVRAAAWLDYGGMETLRSYGVSLPDDPASADPVKLRDALQACLPPAHLAMVRKLELLVEVGDYLFVHAGIRPDVALDRQARRDLLWIRDGFLDHRAPLSRMVVHGHSWDDDRPQLRTNRLGIDTGVYATDVLTGLRLDGATAAYVQVGRGR